jgi:hypothetical protein
LSLTSSRTQTLSDEAPRSDDIRGAYGRLPDLLAPEIVVAILKGKQPYLREADGRNRRTPDIRRRSPIEAARAAVESRKPHPRRSLWARKGVVHSIEFVRLSRGQNASTNSRGLADRRPVPLESAGMARHQKNRTRSNPRNSVSSPPCSGGIRRNIGRRPWASFRFFDARRQGR